jgi:hypothetical protein
LADGRNLTEIVQLFLAGSDDPQVLVCEKSPAFVPPTQTLYGRQSTSLKQP